MIKIVEVSSLKDIKKFVDFPTNLYKGVKQYVHPLRMDELKFFNPKKNVAFKDCEFKCFLAYKDDEIVGRIAGILQKVYNKKVNEKRVRFTRFDCINDVDVAKKLFGAVEAWAKKIKMEVVHGPMGFDDLDREGMLIEGFDEIATFEEQYNFEYYKDLMQSCGYKKEVDWLEYNIKVPEKVIDKVQKVSQYIKKRYNLKMAEKKSKNAFIKKYMNDIFTLIDDTYGKLYGVVPYSAAVKKQVVNQFKLFISLDFISLILDENNKPIAFGFAIPSLSDVVNKCEGKLSLVSLIKILKAVKKPKYLDLALIAVDPHWQSKGVPALIFNEMLQSFIDHKIESVETNLNLEDNVEVQNLWKSYDYRQHKRRRSWFKKLK